MTPSNKPQVQTQEQVMFFDTDCGGVVHNIAYLRMIETCRTRLGEAIGFSVQEMGETMRFPVVLRTEIDYLQPAKLGDQLILHGWLEEWGRVKFTCAFEMKRLVQGKEKDTLVTCKQQLALVQMPEGKVQRLGKAPS